MKFYISDTHFAHVNILKFEPEARPFSSIEEHDEELIKRWNARVGPEDEVIHLGDVCFKPATMLDRIMPRLNGRKTLLLGNHDTLHASHYLQHFEEVRATIENKRLGLLFSHYPVPPSQLEFRYKINVHGHCHSHVIEDKRYINISCEHTALAPLTEPELLTIVNRRARVR